MEKLETIILGTTEEDIRKGADIIRSGGLVAFPTETVYGLGANGMDGEASAKIYAAKGRPSDNPMIVHIADRSELSGLTDEVTADMEILMDAFWPGPMTMVVKAKPEVPKVTTGGLDTVAVRMPNHPVALALIAASGVPIAAPSANASGRPSPTTGQHVIDDLDGRINAVVMGDSCQIGIESTVIDMTGEVPMILRPGKLTEADFEKVLGKPVALDPALLKKPQFISCLEQQDGPAQVMDEDFKPKSPGQKYTHYAPKAEMIIYKGEHEAVRLAIAEAKMERVQRGEKVGVIMYDDNNPEEAAHQFFAELRAMDKAEVDVIFSAALKEDGVGFAVMNRMFKSAGYHIIEV